ncbi:DUF1853 family protein [Paraburkholderia saeva]|uniref:DUF1853 family protein n=1 Tax=Paraburkholderia saeva TaxID=2777537 RepID=UPI001D3E809B|nr:DUF1853 family protein [Paraburkholderia saeva]CAG4892256.1 hypothetical protein R70241_01295 [Paraburkholderia saeva]CAG4899429.1 hypothetical protein R52603_02591 [Paraburkholderia saeva]
MNAAHGPVADAAAPVARFDLLRDAVVRDLAWLLFSPDLLRAQPPAGGLAHLFETPAEEVATIAWLHALDAGPDSLHRHIAASRITRLGRYAECLLGWFLQHGPAARLVAANVALRRAGVTLGECDFLVETASGRRLHWELAVKCYLHAGDGRSQLADYVGPNLQDRFDLKLAHLLDHQLPLSAREEFATLGHRGPWEPAMFIKGWLFYGATQSETGETGETGPGQGAPQVNPAHARGWWATRADWPAFSATQAAVWKVLPRLEWLAPRRYEAGEPSPQTTFVDAATLLVQLERQTGPTMVASFAPDDAGRWIEQSRGFVVPDDWPRRGQAFARQ